MTRSIGIDPATSKSGFALIEDGRLVVAQMFSRPSKMPIAQRIYDMKMFAVDFVREWEPDIIVVEHVRFSKYMRNPDSMVKVAWAMGAVIAELAPLPYTVDTIPANSVRKKFEVKNKAGLRAVVNRRYATDLVDLGFARGLLKSHEDISDAIGLAMVGNILLTKEPK